MRKTNSQNLSVGSFALKFGKPLLIEPDEDRAGRSPDQLEAHEIIEKFNIWAQLQSVEHTFTFAVGIVDFVADLLEATNKVGSREPFALRLASDGEFGISATPERIGSGAWRVHLWPLSQSDSSELQTNHGLLLNLYAAYASLSAACIEHALDLPAQLAKCSSYLQSEAPE